MAETQWVSETVAGDVKREENLCMNLDHQIREDFFNFYIFVEFLAKAWRDLIMC